MTNIQNIQHDNNKTSAKLTAIMRIFPRPDGDEERPDYYDDFLNEFGRLLYETNLIAKNEPEFISDDLLIEVEVATFREDSGWSDLSITFEEDVVVRNWFCSSPEKWAVEEIYYVGSAGQRLDPPWTVDELCCKLGNFDPCSDLITDYLSYEKMMNQALSLSK